MNFSRLSNATLIGRLLRAPLRLIPPSVCLPILQGPLRGKRWIAGSSNHGCWLGSYEYSKQKVFCRVVTAGDIVYDLGAHAGYYSLLASTLVGPAGMVYAFEPLPDNVARIKKHLAVNQVANCVLIEAAVSCSEGSGTFSPGPNSLSGHLSRDQSAATLPVRLVTLDALVKAGAIRPPRVIKCDIEGAEYEALVGGEATIRACKPAIFLATHGPEVHRHCCDLLAAWNYRLESLDGLTVSATSEILAT